MDENQNGKQGINQKIFKFIFVIAAIFVLSFAVLFLWNTILPQTIHVGTISYWQALGLLTLCRLLFGNFNFGAPWRRRPGDNGVKERLMNFDEKDKATFKEEWKRRCENWGK